MSKIHRFYVSDSFKLKKDFWIHDPAMLWQWTKVLRFREGDKMVLFDGVQTDRLYRLEALKKTEAHLVMVTEMSRKIPSRKVYLLWSLLKKDNNELILQKATELGVSNFVPLITERTIKKEFNVERARKIVIEAAEQCGRSDIPHVRDVVHLNKALEEYEGKIPIFICHQADENDKELPSSVGLLIGPEGGWSDSELELFAHKNFGHISLSPFTLRAETAALIAASKVL